MSLNSTSFNMEAAEQSADLIQLLKARAESEGSAPAYHFISAPNKPVETLTYQELYDAAQHLAAQLQLQGAEQQRVLLLNPPSLDYIISFWGCILAGAIAVPAFPPAMARLEQTLPRIEAIIQDCQPQFAIASASLIEKKDRLSDKSAVFGDLTWIKVGDSASDGAWSKPHVAPDDVAFLQYTSGSTSTPKGVMVSHHNLISNSRAIFQALDGDNTLVSWLPPYHDMGLIGNIIQVVYGAGWGYFMSPTTFLRYPYLWLKTLSDSGAKVSVAPNFGYQHCINKLTPEQIETLDLSQWRHALSGAEPVRWSTLTAFKEKFSTAGFQERTFQPCYGLAEATLIVSGGKPAVSERKIDLCAQTLQNGQAKTTCNRGLQSKIESVACGKMALETRVAIVDPEQLTRKQPDQIGEIWVNSPSVAKGYWRRPELSKATFQSKIQGEDDTHYLRTGDLGFIDPQGELHITGRQKDLIVLRGKNFYPNDIENIAQQAYRESTGKVLAFSLNIDGQEELVVLAEALSTDDDEAISLASRVRKSLADEPLQLAPFAVIVVKSGAIPQTSSGKLQRFQAKQQFETWQLPCLYASISTAPLSAEPPARSVRETSAVVWLQNQINNYINAQAASASTADIEVQSFSEVGLSFEQVRLLDHMLRERYSLESHLSALFVKPHLNVWLETVQHLTDQICGPESTQFSRSEIEQHVLDTLSSILGLPTAHIDTKHNFNEIGLDSANSVYLSQQLSQKLNVTLSETFVWEAPNIEQAIDKLYELQLTQERSAEPAKNETTRTLNDEPIAIVGMACRLPQADNIDEFWQLLRSATNAVQPCPSARRSPTPLSTRSGYPVREIGGYLDNIAGFEPEFFGISKREAALMDPQQRILLETSWQAIEHAGIDPQTLSGTQTGVFIAAGPQEYWQLLNHDVQQLDVHSSVGSSQAIASNRISYTLNLHGPSITLDTACSGSLIALHQACQSIRSGEASQALAGGINLMIKPDATVAFTEAQMLSPNGRCATFDQNADGYVRGEGCGVIMLKPLRAALSDGNPIVAVVNGSAIAHDGKSNGITAPNPSAQQAVIEQALKNSKLRAHQIDYVEAHGTGTPLGDPIEVAALAHTYGSIRERRDPCLIGSVKTNIGHLESAAGIVGVIKTALAIQHHFIPAQLHCDKPTQRFDWQSANLAIATQAQRWPTRGSEKRAAGVSSFGFGGSIAHIILSSAPSQPEPTPSTRPELVTLSARTENSLRKLIHRVHQTITNQPNLPLANIATTLRTGRTGLSKRIALVARDTSQLYQKLQDITTQKATYQPVNSAIKRTIAFCFSGQGSQYSNMARELFDNPIFVNTLEECNVIWQEQSPSAPSLQQLITHSDHQTLLQHTQYQQPLLYAIQAGVYQVWCSQGIKPDVVIGHSIGELAAMFAANIYSLTQGMQLAILRGRLMGSLPAEGKMLAWSGNQAELNSVLKQHSSKLWLAVNNAPNSKVLAGHESIINQLLEQHLEGVSVTKLKVSHAFHTPMMEKAAIALREKSNDMSFSEPEITMISTLTGELLNNAPDAHYLAEQMRNPVQFESAINTAITQGINTFVEIGPGQSLLNFTQRTAKQRHHELLCLPSMLKNQDAYTVLLNSVGSLWQHGHQFDKNNVELQSKGRKIHMPSYEFDDEQYWCQPSALQAQATPDVTPNVTPQGGAKNSQQQLLNAALSLFHNQTAVLNNLTQSGGQMAVALPEPTQQQWPASTQHPLPAPQPSQPTPLLGLNNEIITLVANVAGCGPNDVQPQDKLHSQLGLDSLMIQQLDKQFIQRWPQLSNVDRAQFAQDPSITDVVHFIEAVLKQPSPNAVSHTSPATPAAQDVSNDWVVPAQEQESNHAPTLQEVEPELDFEHSEQYQNHIARLNMINAIGENPYGRIHHGTNSGRAVLDERNMLNFAAFNYTALSNHPDVINATKEAVDTYGTSPSATPLLFGETPLHHELESEIADFLGCEAAAIFASGHSTSVAVIGHIMDKQDLVIHDQWIHDCAVRGAMLSGAQRRSFSHDDWQELDRILAKIRKYYRRVLIVIEGIYSQDGDIGNLPAFIEIKKKHNCMLMIDEAHSIGVLGETGAGAGEYYNVDRNDVDIWMGTLSKGLGSCGGYIAASKNFIQFLKYTTPLLIFSTGITPANAAAALQAIRVLRQEPKRLETLRNNSTWFLNRAKELGLDCGPSHDSPVIPIIVGEWEIAMWLSAELRKKDINVMPIGYPAVEKHRCRLRFFMNVEHTQEELEYALQSLVTSMKALNVQRNDHTIESV